MIVYVEDVARALDVIAASELARAMQLVADIDKLPLTSLGIYQGKEVISPARLREVLGVDEGGLTEIRQECGNSGVLKRYWMRRLNDASCVLKLDEKAKAL